MQKNGTLIQEDYFDNTGGLNTSNSAFTVKDGDSTGGYNYSYNQTGAVSTRHGHEKINSSPDSNLQTIGLGQHITSGGTKTIVRAANTKLQAVDTTVPSFTALTEDTATASSTVFSSTAVQVCFSQFNTATGNTLWAAGGGVTNLKGVLSSTKYTSNGVAAPTGSFTATQSATGGSFASTGTYFYAVALRKASTQALSNAALDVSATISATTDKVTINVSGLTGIDTTLYDKIYIYRSAVSGVTAFTTGDLIAQINSNVTSYVDTGTYISTAQNVPRAGNTILDNSQLTAQTYSVITTWKRRLVTANNSTLYISDLNKPESWPTANTITVPSGGPITGLAVISFASDLSNNEYLAIFKERELWILSGSSVSDWTLNFVDTVGCPNQNLIVTANGYLFFIAYRGVHYYDGTGKPVYLSKPIEDIFDQNGTLDKSQFAYGCGTYIRRNNEVIWYLSHKIYGVQKFAIRLDLRLTLARMNSTLSGRIMDGCFLYDKTAFAVYGALSYIPSGGSDELCMLGDNAGYVYNGYNVTLDAGSSFGFQYATKTFHMGNPSINKRFLKVIVWVQQSSTDRLYLDYWTGYKADDAAKSTVSSQIKTSFSSNTALWDVGYWDQAYWDSYNARGVPLVFNLKADGNNGTEGPAIRLQFRNDAVASPITINGFSIIYSEMGMVAEKGIV